MNMDARPSFESTDSVHDVAAASAALTFATFNLRNADVFDSWSPPPHWGILQNNQLDPMWFYAALSKDEDDEWPEVIDERQVLSDRIQCICGILECPPSNAKTHPLDHDWVIQWLNAWIQSSTLTQPNVRHIHRLLALDTWRSHPRVKEVASVMHEHMMAEPKNSDSYFDWWLYYGAYYQGWGFEVPVFQRESTQFDTDPMKKTLFRIGLVSQWPELPWFSHHPKDPWKPLWPAIDPRDRRDWVVHIAQKKLGHTLSMRDHPEVPVIKAYLGLPLQEDEAREHPQLQLLSAAVRQLPYEGLDPRLHAAHGLCADVYEFLDMCHQMQTLTPHSSLDLQEVPLVEMDFR